MLKEGLDRGQKITLKSSGESMLPVIKEGDSLLIEGVENIQPGQIIAYLKSRGDWVAIVAHRVMTVRDDGFFISRGDNINKPDPEWISPDKIIGRVCQINGKTVDELKKKDIIEK